MRFARRDAMLSQCTDALWLADAAAFTVPAHGWLAARQT